MDLSVITNKASEQLVSFAKLALNNSMSKKFWINKLKSFSYLDIAVLLGFTSFELWSLYTQYAYENDKINPTFIEENIQLINSFIRDLKDENQTPRNVYSKYFAVGQNNGIAPTEQMQVMTYGLGTHHKFLKSFQTEELFNSMLDVLCLVDARLKKTALEQNNFDYEPNYSMSEQTDLQMDADDLMALTGLRRLSAQLLYLISLPYDNVPMSSIEKIVAFSSNENQSFALRRLASVLLLNLSAKQSNIHNIIKAKAYTIVKYYDHIEDRGRNYDQEAISNIITGVGFSSIPREVTSRLSASEYQILKSDITNYRLKFIVHKLITSSLTFSFSYGLSKNLLSSATTILPAIANGTTFKPEYKIANILQIAGLALFVPYWKSSMAILLCTGSSPSELLAVYRLLRSSPTKNYSNKQYDQMFPSADAILNNSTRA